jgi:hypothetical protein
MRRLVVSLAVIIAAVTGCDRQKGAVPGSGDSAATSTVGLPPDRNAKAATEFHDDSSGTTGTSSAETHDRDSELASTQPVSEPDSAASVDEALEALRAYYVAINQREYARAYNAWGPDGPPGHPGLGAFARGFTGTVGVSLKTGDPGRIEGAAGSRYIRVPVVVNAIHSDKRVVRYVGSYTLRRSVVTGATQAEQRWHLYSAKLRRDTTEAAPDAKR